MVAISLLLAEVAEVGFSDAVDDYEVFKKNNDSYHRLNTTGCLK